METEVSTIAGPKRIVIFGAGGHGRVCADIARRTGYEIVGFSDPAYDAEFSICGVTVLPCDDYELFRKWPDQAFAFPAIGDNSRRETVFTQLTEFGVPVATLVDPSAVVSPSAHVAAGVAIMPGAVVNAEVDLKPGCIVNTSAIVEHGSTLADHAHLAPGACATGDCRVGRRSLVGARATVLPGVSIGADVLVGAGAVVTRDTDDGVTLIGVPAVPVSAVRN